MKHLWVVLLLESEKVSLSVCMGPRQHHDNTAAIVWYLLSSHIQKLACFWSHISPLGFTSSWGTQQYLGWHFIDTNDYEVMENNPNLRFAVFKNVSPFYVYAREHQETRRSIEEDCPGASGHYPPWWRHSPTASRQSGEGQGPSAAPGMARSWVKSSVRPRSPFGGSTNKEWRQTYLQLGCKVCAGSPQVSSIQVSWTPIV